MRKPVFLVHSQVRLKTSLTGIDTDFVLSFWNTTNLLHLNANFRIICLFYTVSPPKIFKYTGKIFVCPPLMILGY